MNEQILIAATLVLVIFGGIQIALAHWISRKSFERGRESGLTTGYLRGRREERAVAERELEQTLRNWRNN